MNRTPDPNSRPKLGPRTRSPDQAREPNPEPNPEPASPIPESLALPSCPNQGQDGQFRGEFSEHSMLQRCRKCERVVSPNRICRTLHAPVPPLAKNSERSVNSQQSSEDAPRSSAAALLALFAGRSMRKQREESRDVPLAGRPPKTARGSSIVTKNRKTLHGEPESQPH